LNQLIIAEELDYISKENYLSVREKIEKIAYMLNSLKKSIIS